MTDTTSIFDDTGLSTSQQERRERMLRATSELARRGGYDAVQMRDVADRAGVGLATLYRYFPSKVHLLVALMRQQGAALRDAVDRSPPDGDTPTERVLALLRRATRGFQREPRLTEAMFRALMFADLSAAQEVRAVTRATCDMFLHAMDPEVTDHDPEREDVALVIAQVWQTNVLNWLSGRMAPDEMFQKVEIAVRLLLRETAPTAPGTPEPA